MKLIQPLSIAALAVALNTSASAFPYTQPHYGPQPTMNSAYAPTVAVSANGKGVDGKGKTATGHRSVKRSNSAQGN